MKIVSVESTIVNVPYKRREVSSVVARDGVTDVLVKIVTDDGLVGWGGPGPRPLPPKRLWWWWPTSTGPKPSGWYKQSREQGSGSMILTATVDALIGTAGLDSYTAAKGGVVALTRSLAAGVGPHGVRVNCVCPGFVATESQMDWLSAPAARRMMDPSTSAPPCSSPPICPSASRCRCWAMSV